MRGADGSGITFTKEGRAHDSNKVRGVARGGGGRGPPGIGQISKLSMYLDFRKRVSFRKCKNLIMQVGVY